MAHSCDDGLHPLAMLIHSAMFQGPTVNVLHKKKPLECSVLSRRILRSTSCSSIDHNFCFSRYSTNFWRWWKHISTTTRDRRRLSWIFKLLHLCLKRQTDRQTDGRTDSQDVSFLTFQFPRNFISAPTLAVLSSAVTGAETQLCFTNFDGVSNVWSEVSCCQVI